MTCLSCSKSYPHVPGRGFLKNDQCPCVSCVNAPTPSSVVLKPGDLAFVRHDATLYDSESSAMTRDPFLPSKKHVYRNESVIIIARSQRHTQTNSGTAFFVIAPMSGGGWMNADDLVVE